MNYTLNTNKQENKKQPGIIGIIRSFGPLLLTEKRRLIFALIAIFINALFTLATPIVIGRIIDTYIASKQYHGVLVFSGILLGLYIGAFISSYLQTKLMGTVGQRVLYNVRNALFEKLQFLPIAFFNQNKAGDLISRINNDTDKLNVFLSQSLVQFVGGVFVMIGASIFLLIINFKLGLITLLPAFFILIFTRFVSPWVRKKNTQSLKSTGGLSAEIQESIENFKVIVAFNRRDYFRTRFDEVNTENYKSTLKAGIANNIFMPVYGLASNISQIVILVFGIYLITTGNFTLGLLVSFLSYASNFYTPLRQIAAVWANFQVAMAGWDRISDILALKSNLEIIETNSVHDNSLLTFKDVQFSYPDGNVVLENINFSLEKGKTYALVGPTGGGKTTTASLIARLYDPVSGSVFLHGKDMRSYSSEERTQKIGFILQEPFLFGGTVRDNIIYGNSLYKEYTHEQVDSLIKEKGLEELINKFDQGLDTPIRTSGESMSLGQKQLIAFMRALLRSPDILILDEATANVDTVTEILLQKVLDKLPEETTRVIIAHRLHTIEKADEIFFVNGGEIINAGTMEHAVEMLMSNKRKS